MVLAPRYDCLGPCQQGPKRLSCKFPRPVDKRVNAGERLNPIVLACTGALAEHTTLHGHHSRGIPWAPPWPV